MVKRKRVGFLFSYNENWIAGTYYLLNIINALNTLEDTVKPIIVIITKDTANLKLVKKETNYPYLKVFIHPQKLSKLQRGINMLGSLFGQIIFSKNKKIPVDFLYPDYTNKLISKNLKKVTWIPDFQERFLPAFFSDTEIVSRKKWQTNIAKNNDIVVFSSENAKNHFTTFYKDSRVKKIVLHFAVTLPDFSKLDTKQIISKHHLPKSYFFAPNQFWAHKNHITILKAVKILKEKGIEVFVAFSGKDHDYRNKDYVASLKKFIIENNIEKNISFLGFLDRKEQLLILKNSIAVIQPSLFEGWSTVVEDSKALNKHIILSDLEVHKEQINVNCDFFERENEQQLSMFLEKYYINLPKEEFQIDYKTNIHKFGEDFVKLIEKATK